MGWTTQFDCHAQLGRLLLPAFLVATLLQPVRAATSPKELLATGQADEAIQTLDQNISHSFSDAASPPANSPLNSIRRKVSTISGWAAFTERKPTAPESFRPLAW